MSQKTRNTQTLRFLKPNRFYLELFRPRLSVSRRPENLSLVSGGWEALMSETVLSARASGTLKLLVQPLMPPVSPHTLSRAWHRGHSPILAYITWFSKLLHLELSVLWSLKHERNSALSSKLANEGLFRVLNKWGNSAILSVISKATKAEFCDLFSCQ